MPRSNDYFLFIALLWPTLLTAAITATDWVALKPLIKNTVAQLFVIKQEIDPLKPWATPKHQQGVGSGFFFNLKKHPSIAFDTQGYLLTNRQIVENAVKMWIEVPETGKRRIPVIKLGECPQHDVALIKVTPEGMNILRKELNVQEIPTLTLGDSDAHGPLDSALTIGFQVGEQSLIHTTVEIRGYLNAQRFGKTYMQTSAPTNPGSSGGPLVNNQGEAIGITTSGVPDAQNVGLVIPINSVLAYLNNLREPKVFDCPTLGILCTHGSDDMARYLGNPLPSGLPIYYVAPGSIAQKAGMQAGDMLYNFNGYELDQFGDTHVPWRHQKVSLTELFQRCAISEELSFTVWRNGKKLKLQGKCEKPPIYPIRYRYGTPDYELLGGITIMELSENHFEPLTQKIPSIDKKIILMQYWRPEYRTKPILVITDIIPHTRAYDIGGYMVGYLIKEINNVPVGTLAELRDILLKTYGPAVGTDHTNWLTITTVDDIHIVFDLDKLLEDQQVLAAQQVTPLTKTVKKLLELLHDEKG